MKLAIHNGKDKATSWNTKWMDICGEHNIEYIGVDCYCPFIIKELKEKEVTHLMWAFSLAFSKDMIMARDVLNSVEKMGISVFPNFNTSWYFEDKIAQKYLMESIDADFVKSWTFFDKQKAISFLHDYRYPIVAKLRRGAGSHNVKLITSYNEAHKYVNRMFGKGYNPVPSNTNFMTSRIRKTSQQGISVLIKKLIERPKKFIERNKSASLFPPEKGYVYFQEFLPNNNTDLRIAIVGNRAWGFYRGTRKNDFRASGSGIIIYDKEIPLDVIEKSFEYTKKLGTQSLCFDYVKDNSGVYRVVEICYGYIGKAIYNSNGYWDSNLAFHAGHFYPEEAILKDFLPEQFAQIIRI
jgi:glutathione synthase/RimK-type ligase-like ATP-grasp enzyme